MFSNVMSAEHRRRLGKAADELCCRSLYGDASMVRDSIPEDLLNGR
jgi:hypothetical protein